MIMLRKAAPRKELFMFALFVISGIAALICGCIGVFDLMACVPYAPHFSGCRNRLLRGAALIVIPAAVMLLSISAMF